ncbi:hypothetical protein M514_06137 [Trichuris suis]|uniref:Uncharacterized protein n=1 Tax=Trichuris suis TaxID=68888 RepID=A0A085NK43_9BILA|nr:hypothetical protein M513_06137 [Trichuris suis]KFD69839.1 hypothetical protein M514_06137 [Trichuris suis]
MRFPNVHLVELVMRIFSHVSSRRCFIEMTKRDVSVQVDSFYENLSLEDLRRCCFLEDKTVQSAISRTIVHRTEMASYDLAFLSGIFDGVPLSMLKSHVMMIFAAISSQARRGLKLVRENATLPAPISVRNSMSVDTLIMVQEVMTILKNAQLCLHRIKKVSEFADELDVDLLYIEFEQAVWLSQAENAPAGH